MGLEMMCRIDKPTLILVPNLTLQEQWKDKLEKMFLETNESSAEMISTEISHIRKVNIITYQSLTGNAEETDEIRSRILDLWYQDEKGDFTKR